MSGGFEGGLGSGAGGFELHRLSAGPAAPIACSAIWLQARWAIDGGSAGFVVILYRLYGLFFGNLAFLFALLTRSCSRLAAFASAAVAYFLGRHIC
jgi:hypothetical protein